MKIRPLVINDDSKREIKRVVDWADQNRFTLRNLLRIIQGKEAPPGDSRNYTCVVPLGYRCVFSIEEQTNGWFRHISISVLGDGEAPNAAAVEMLMKEFGMTCDLGVMSKNKPPDQMDNEDIGGGKIAVNVWEKLP